MEQELKGIVNERLWHSSKWLSELLRAGAPVHKIAPMEYLKYVSGPVVVPNPAFLDSRELEAVLSYKNGSPAFIGILPDKPLIDGKLVVSRDAWTTVGLLAGGMYGESETFFDSTPRPLTIESLPERGGGAWPCPILYHPVAEGFMERCAEVFTSICNHPVLEGNTAARNVIQVHINENTDRFLVDNDEYYYAIPALKVNREIESVKFMTKPAKYPARVTEKTVTFRVPGRGMDIFEIRYKK
jgi:hypothetical protein